MEMSVRRAVQQALTPSKRKDGRSWRENRRLLSKSDGNVCGRTSRMLSNLDIAIRKERCSAERSRARTVTRDVERQKSATFELTMRLYVCRYIGDDRVADKSAKQCLESSLLRGVYSKSQALIYV